jgi:hypothetical protein
MKMFFLVAALSSMLMITVVAHAQQFDAAFGLGTVSAPSAASATGDHFPQSIGGGTFISFSGDYLFKHHFGAGAEVAWRASQNNYVGVAPFRPIFYDFNGVYAPPLGKKAALELQAGIGAQSTRFYGSTVTCNTFTGTCTNYTSSNHFMGHFGGGIRLYPVGNFFIRPEAHLYLVNNNFEFSSAHSVRYGVSIGYTFGGRDQ